MLHVVAFYAILLVCLALAWVRGGAPERAVAICFASGFAATLLNYSAIPQRFVRVEAGIAVIDTVMLLILGTIALRADRAWPLAVAALQLDIVMVHVIKVIDASMMRPVYAIMMTVWAYPQLALLIAGVIRHQQRLRSAGVDKAWSTGT